MFDQVVCYLKKGSFEALYGVKVESTKQYENFRFYLIKKMLATLTTLY